MSILTMMLRKGCTEGDAKRDAGLVYPEDVIRMEDISYGSHKQQELDVYRPKDVEVKLPVIVSVHGGGWVYGDKKLYSHYCTCLAQKGFVVVNFTYRLSPETKYPCQLEDTVKVFDWVKQNADQYGMDMDHVFAVGDSAGGHILSLYCSICTNPEYAAKYDFVSVENLLPNAIALNCAVLDIDAIKNSAGSSTLALMNDVLPRRKKKEYMPLINPIEYVNEKYPPCMIMTCNEDFLREQPATFMKKLEACGVPYVYKFYGDDDNRL